MYLRGQIHLIFILLVLSLPWPSISDSDTNRYLACRNPTVYTCGGQTYNISFPLGSPNRPSYCSLPEFDLICSLDDTSLSMDILDNDYQVESINYSDQVLTVVNPSFTGQYSCPQEFDDNTIDDTSFLNQNNTSIEITTAYINFTSTSLPGLAEIKCYSGPPLHSYYGSGTKSNSTLTVCEWVKRISINQISVATITKGNEGFEAAVQSGFCLRWSILQKSCSSCMDSGGACWSGSSDSGSTDLNGFACYYASSPSGMRSGSSSKGTNTRKKKVIIVVIGSISGILTVVVFLFLYVYHVKGSRKKLILRQSPQRIESFLEKSEHVAPKRYKYSDLKKMTKSFSKKLGQGGYGVVYKGVLHDGHDVAVKVLITSRGNGEDFLNEVASIGRTSHVNIVRLVGFCYHGSRRAIIYDFMPNGSLERFIYAERSKTSTPLGWERLFNITVGIARGLEYLHRGCNTRIVHFDIKPHNILLDKDFCPKITDFGLAKLCPPQRSIISMSGARGTPGYIAPEVFSRKFGVISSKSDVYSFGMMVMEIVGGRENINAGADSTSQIYLPHQIYEHIDRDGDLEVYGVTSESKEIARKMMIVGLWCIQTLPENRPSMSRVLEMLEGSISSLEMPPKP